MHAQRNAPVSGHVWRYQGKRGAVWYAKYRLPDGRQVQKRLGPVWTAKGRPPDGYFTERTAKAALEATLTDARRGTLPGLVRTGATFNDAAEEWYQHGTEEGGPRGPWKPSTRRDYRSVLNVHLLPAFADLRLEDLTARKIESWRRERMQANKLTRRTAIKVVAVMHGIYERARRTYGLRENPVADVERIRDQYDPARFDFYTPEEVAALVRAAASERDGAIYLTAAYTGARMGELLALRVRDIDFAADSIRILESVDREAVGRPKSGHGRTVPMVAEVAHALARILQRDLFSSPDDHVFVGEAGGHLDGSALRRRYKQAQTTAGLRKLRFHDLRHTFGSLAARQMDPLEVQTYLGHADAKTTRRYLHYRPRTDEAKRLAKAFTVEKPSEAQKVVEA